MEAIAGLFVTLAGAVMELLVHLLALVFSASWVAAHLGGLKRVAYGVMAITALHIFLAIALALINELQPYLLSPLFSWPAILVSAGLLVVSIVLPIALDIANYRSAAAAADPAIAQAEARAENATVPMILSYVMAIALVMGLIAMWSSQSTRVSVRVRLTEKLCAEAGARGSPTIGRRAAMRPSASPRSCSNAI